MGFAKNVGGNEPKNMPLYRAIFFYTVLVIVIIVATVVTDMATSSIDSIAVPLLSFTYILSLISLYRSRKGTLPRFVDFIFGLAVLQMTIYLLLELLQRYAFYKGNIGSEPVIFAVIIQTIIAAILLSRTRKA